MLCDVPFEVKKAEPALFAAPAYAGPAPRRAAPRHPGTQLVRAVMQLAGGQAEILRHAERPWASVTFSGARHTLVLRFAGAEGCAAGEAFVAALADHEFTLRGQLVADAAVTAVVHDLLPEPCMVVDAELLLLEEA